MSASDQTFWNLPASLPEDLSSFERNVAQFKAGAISATQFQVFRVPQGVYEQRESGTYMLRVRFPAGAALPHQLIKLADVAQQYGNGILHVTTRQDIQVHRVLVDAIHPALSALAQAGLSTKGGGGNTVRNITGCPHAGVCARETFDVTPHVLALTEFLLADPLSFQMPRKYKIAFSGCGNDCSAATVNDLGFIAKSLDGVDGFSVYVAGGLGSSSRVADLLEEFVPAADVPLIAEAIKRLFNAHGNRKDKRLARLRFLIRQLGFDTFRNLYREQLGQLRRQPPAVPPLQSLGSPDSGLAPKPNGGQPRSADWQSAVSPAGSRQEVGAPKQLERLADSQSATQPTASRRYSDASSPAFDRWLSANVKPQKQDGFFWVEIPLFLGDIASPTLRALAEIVADHGEGSVRATQNQNLTLRWVRQEELGVLHQKLSALGLAESYPPVLRDLVACTGAATCKLGICLSRGVAKGVADRLSRSSLDLHSLGKLQVNISGCPNACGRHPLASVGFHGAARRVDGRLVPHYIVQFGGHVEEGKTELAAGRQAIAARHVPAFLEDLLGAYAQFNAQTHSATERGAPVPRDPATAGASRRQNSALPSAPAPDFRAFLKQSGDLIDGLLNRYKNVPGFAEDPGFYVDWGAQELFSLAGRGPGECGAGVFDLIDVDLKSAAEALPEQKLFSAAALASRALLVTRGEQASSDQEAFNLFQKHFLDAELIAGRFRPLVALGLRAAQSPNPVETFKAPLEEVAAFVAAVQALFKGMDATLQFPKNPSDKSQPTSGGSDLSRPQTQTEAPAPTAADSAGVTVHLERDYRGVVCPLNYVKTKMSLGKLKVGQVLAVLLDPVGVEKVPASAEADGHEIISITEVGKDSKVLIRRGK